MTFKVKKKFLQGNWILIVKHLKEVLQTNWILTLKSQIKFCRGIRQWFLLHKGECYKVLIVTELSLLFTSFT